MQRNVKFTAIALALVALAGCASLAPQSEVRVVGHAMVRHAAVSDADAQYALGKHHLAQKRPAAALISFTRAIEADPRHAEAFNGRAAALLQFGDTERALEDIARAIELAPGSSHLLNNQGYVRMLHGDYEGAAASLRQAHRFSPRDERVVANWHSLAARVSANPSLASKLGMLAEGTGQGLAALPPVRPTAAVVEAIVREFSGSVLNLSYSGPLAARQVTGSSPAPAASAVSVTPFAVSAARNAGSTVHFVPHSAHSALSAEEPASTPPAHVPVISITNPEAVQEQPAGPLGEARSIVTFGATVAAPMALVRPSEIPVASGAIIDVAPSTRAARIEVTNGNGVRGMAAEVSRQLRTKDFRVTRITNASGFDREQTRIYFREGFMAEALQLSRTLAARPAVMLTSAIAPSADVQLVLGRDIATLRAPLAVGEPIAIASASNLGGVAQAR